jgi:hypothetical protein
VLQQGDRIKQRDVVQGLLDEALVPAITFKRCAEQYIDAHLAGWSNAKHAKQWPSSLEQYVYPIIGKVPVSQLTGKNGTHLICQVLDPIWRQKPATASRVRGRIEKVLSWAKAKGYRDGDNPARWDDHLAAIYPTKEKVAPTKHMAAMPYRDLPAFMGKLRKGIAANIAKLPDWRGCCQLRVLVGSVILRHHMDAPTTQTRFDIGLHFVTQWLVPATVTRPTLPSRCVTVGVRV